MASYKRKPFVIVEASELELPWQDADGRVFNAGDYIVTKENGEMYGVQRDIFHTYFELAKERDVRHVRNQKANRNWQSKFPRPISIA